LGALEGAARLNVTRDPGKSSLLEPDLQTISQFSPITDWTVSSVALVQIKSLDSALLEHLLVPPDFIKIDVQGYELEVLKGAEKTLPYVTAIEVETTLVPLYHEQPTCVALNHWLAQRGFTLVALKTTGTFGGEGVHVVEFDAFFVNRALVEKNQLAIDIWLRTNRIRRGGTWMDS
jgi:hypothetical protein